MKRALALFAAAAFLALGGYADAFAAVYDQVVSEFSLPPAPFLLDGFATDLSQFQADGVHPRAEAQGRILANMLPTLAPLIHGCDLSTGLP